MRRRASLDADQTRFQSTKQRKQLVPFDFPSKHRSALAIDAVKLKTFFVISNGSW
jgi:hypothetical protein